MEIEYLIYYAKETGANSHPHDLEPVVFQIAVHSNGECSDYKFDLEVKRVIARAHGLYWYDNTLTVDEFTLFPMTILVEEGKHANCTDKNADGKYTPGYDVNEKVNDAWGIRDIISTGRLFSGGYQEWMQKDRKKETVIFPPTAPQGASTKKIMKRVEFSNGLEKYTLRPFPDNPSSFEDKKLEKLVKQRKPAKWPLIKPQISPTKEFSKLSKDDVLRNKLGLSWRTDGLGLSIPLLLVRHVEAPMTGGWFYHKVYTENFTSNLNGQLFNVIGHQIQHSNSASRWLDTYVGLGYEYIYIDDDQPTNDEFEFVSEAGIKIRLNIRVTPLKFLKFLGTDFWGIKIGWKNRGFDFFNSGGFVIEIGAGAF